MRDSDEDRRARARSRYEQQRAAALAAIATLSRGGPVPLDAAARLLPDHPEWARYAPRRGR